MTLDLRNKTSALLAAMNLLLLAAAWVMSTWSYPRVPETMAARLSVFGLEFGSRTRSPLFFLLPVIQTLLNLLVVAGGRAVVSRSRNVALGALRRENIYLGMIFVNAALIHLQKNVISLAYLGQASLNSVYLVTIAVVLFLIFIYYRIRKKSGI